MCVIFNTCRDDITRVTVSVAVLSGGNTNMSHLFSDGVTQRFNLVIWNITCVTNWGSIVGVVTCSGLDDLGIESLWG
jgi:hypothetical protein